MTLRSRVTVAAGVAVAVAIAVASLAAWLVVRAQMYREIDDALETQATAMENRPGPRPTPTGAQPSDDTSDFFTESYLQVLDDEGGVVSSLGERELPVGADERAVATGAAPSAVSTVSANGVSVRVYTAATQDGAVQFGRSLAEVEGTLSRLAMALAAVAVAGIGLAAILGRATAAAATAPVQRLSWRPRPWPGPVTPPTPSRCTAATSWGGWPARSTRCSPRSAPRSAVERELVADASHELRTPVPASARTSRSSSAPGTACRPRSGPRSSPRWSPRPGRCPSSSPTCSRSPATRRRAARPTGSGSTRKCWRRWSSLARRTRRSPSASTPSRAPSWAPTRVRRAVLNLVDNAAKWSPPGGTVEVTVRGRR